MFDWEDLRHFAVFARQGTLSAAARELKVDHATVARRLAALEAALTLALVDRRPRAYVLTEDGARLAALAQGMEEAAFAVGRAARAARPGLAGEVTISAPPSMATMLIAPRLGELRARHPDIHVRLIGEKRSASLSRREADLAVRLTRPSEKQLVARKIGSLAFALYGAPAYLAQRAPAAYEFIAYDEGSDDLPQQRWLLAHAGTRRIVLRTNDLEAQAASVAAGVGLALLPRFIGDRHDGLQRIDLEGKPVSREIWLVVHTDLRRAPPVRAVMDFVAACLR